MIPSEKDLQNDASYDLNKYLKISDTEAFDVIALNRLAWELSSSSFAGRQVQYERFFFGSRQNVINRLYQGYSGLRDSSELISRFLES